MAAATDQPAATGADDRRRVVVGVDGSPGSRTALVFALITAAQRGAVLEVVSAYPVRLVWTGGTPVDVPDVDVVREGTLARIRDVVDEVRRDPAVAGLPGMDDVDVRQVVSEGPAVRALLDRAGGADLLVVGSRGRGAMRSALLGSVALHCLTQAPCPVVVAHASPESVGQPPRVVVGVDGSAASQAALRAAIDEAARSGADVEVIASYVVTDYWTDLASVVVPSLEQVRADLTRRVDELVSEALAGRGNGPPVTVTIVEGSPSDELVQRARGATLLVVGSHGRGPIRGLLLGSVALHCAMHASVPVLVVHRPSGGADRPAGHAEPALAEN